MSVQGQASCQRTPSASRPPTKNQISVREQELDADDLVIAREDVRAQMKLP